VDLIAIGASTGGVSAIEEVLEGVAPGPFPAIVVTQHIPAGFSRKFADRLNAKLHLEVKEAQNGMPLSANSVYLAPGGQQLSVAR
jgi:two-component system chemotaxis response regulator CheB